MTEAEKLQLLKFLSLLSQIPEPHIIALGQYLKVHELADGAVIFEEGSRGESLYFVATGHVRISKRVAGESLKDLAILGPGDSFGEMAVLEDPRPRSARAWAQGAVALFELSRDDLNAWLKAHPELALGFFAHLVQIQSRRLRRTSNELAMLFDLSSLLLEPAATGPELIGNVLSRLLPHLSGSWSAAGYLYNMFNDEVEIAATRGEFNFGAFSGQLPAATETRNFWLDDARYYVSLPGAKRPQGFLLFAAPTALSEDDRNETGRTLTTVARLLTAALENIGYRTEDALRERLSQSHQHGRGV